MKHKLLTTILLSIYTLTLNAAQVGISISPGGQIEEIISYSSIEESITVPVDQGLQIIPILVTAETEPEDPEILKFSDLEPVDINIKGSSLSSAIKLCANACDMNYIAPPEGDTFNESVSLDVRSNPYMVLKLLCETYHIGLEHKNSIWQFYKINLNELIQRTYKIRYNTQEHFKIKSPSINASINKSNASAFAQDGDAGSQDVFTSKTDLIVEELQKYLDLPTTGMTASDGNSVDNPSQANIKSSNSPKGSVIFNSDNNELIVVATRQQQSYIKKYLESVDRPQQLIKIDALLVETNRNPQKDLGVDWSGVSGTTLNATNISTDAINLNKSISGVIWPFTTLSASDMSLTLNFIESDSESSITQDPKVVTTNNREVSLKSVIQQPIESGSSVDTTLATRSNVSSIDYIEIGTIINIHPKIVDDYMGAEGDKAVQLNVSLVVSSEIGKQVIDKKQFPVISSRTYNYTVIVPTGRTLAIGGLSESQETNIEKKIPLLGDLPIIGAVFRNKSEIKKKRNLVAFITPTILG